MKVRLDILRTGKKVQSVIYESENQKDTLANALMYINSHPETRDVSGEKIPEIKWEHSCLQKKCGACAMVINGRPALACDTFLLPYDGKSILVEPLKKFPLIEDLMVDRSILRENLKNMKVWASGELKLTQKKYDTAYDASRCLQCGCCLEVCPNFFAGGKFFGMASSVPSARIISETDKKERKQLSKEYSLHVYEGCGKSLACRDICPAGIDIDSLLVKTNAAAVWKRN